jgi:hypothetical protein
LIDFHHLKFDDVEIPGQYVQVSLPLRIKILNGADWAVAC